MLKKIFLSIKDLIYPPACRVCGRRLLDNEVFICGDCLFEMPLTMQCDYPYNNFMHSKFKGIKIDRACCYFVYKRGSNHKSIIKNIKFGGDKALGLKMGEMFGVALEGSEEFRDIDFVVPVPLHKRRLRNRGYNQSDIIAEGVARMLNIPLVTTAIVRVRSTRPQSTLRNYYDRKENMKDAFMVVDKEVFKGKNILIIDDVATTGETISSMIVALHKGGYRSIGINVATLSATGY